MLPFKWVRIMKSIDILSICIVVGSVLFGESLIGDRESKVLTVSVLLAMHSLKPIICRAIFVCPHCGQRGILRGKKWWPSWPNRDDVVFCPHCGKAVLFED